MWLESFLLPWDRNSFTEFWLLFGKWLMELYSLHLCSVVKGIYRVIQVVANNSWAGVGSHMYMWERVRPNEVWQICVWGTNTGKRVWRIWGTFDQKGTAQKCQIARSEGQTFKIIYVVFIYEKNFLIIFTSSPKMLNVSSNAKKPPTGNLSHIPWWNTHEFKRLKINRGFFLHKDFSILCSEKLFIARIQFLICS